MRLQTIRFFGANDESEMPMQQFRHLTRNVVPRGMRGRRQHIQQLVKGFEICRHNDSACSRTTHDEMPLKIW
jgi:hypothetical protein